MTLKTGEQVAGYRIERVIGAGGMGVVYEATQVALDRSVALKILAPGLSEDDDFRARFRQEATLQAALEHPNVVAVYEAGESEDGLFIAMRLVRGTDLKKLIEGGLAPERALDILAQAAAALDAAHAYGLVHRDIKPQNILVDDEGHTFLADFGLTKGMGDHGRTLTGSYTGSLDYAAPEQIRGEPYGPPGDLYAFAAVLLEALTGEVAFPHDTEAALLYAHLSEEPPRPSARRPELPSGLDAVVARGLAKRPDDRYRTAGELVADARRALASQPIAAPNGNGGGRRFSETIVDGAVLRAAPVIAVQPVKRHIPWATVALAAVALIALVVGGFAIGRVSHSSSPPKLGVAQAGPVSLTFRSDSWKSVPAPSIPGLALESTVALASTDPNRPGTIVAGMAPDAQGTGLLPEGLRAQLTGAAPTHVVRVGSVQGLDYPSLPAGKVPWQMSLLLVPTPNGAAAVTCLIPRVLLADAKPADCDSVAATLKLHGIHALPLGQTSAYAAAVSSALTLLNGERLAGRRQLAGATTPAEQARGATALASAFAAAARKMAAVSPSPLARPAHDVVVTKLRNAAADYTALAAAARTHAGTAYRRAATRVDAAEQAVDTAVARLESVKAAG